VECGDGYDGEVQRVDLSGYDGLETHYCGGGLEDGVDAAVGSGCMGLSAFDAESVVISF
jgi:hypothetical protein